MKCITNTQQRKYGPILLGKQTGEVDGNSLSDIIDADAIGASIKSDDTSATVWVRAESLLDFLADIGPR